MGSTYTDNGGIEKIGLGEQAGAWGTTTNNNFDIIDRLINGVKSLTLSGGTTTLSTSDGSLSDGMFKVLVLAGSPTSGHVITIDPPSADKLYFVKNGTSEDVAFSQGSGDNATVSAGKGAIIFADGAGTAAAVTDLTALFVNSQAIDGAVIGGTTPAAITGTTITANTSILPDASGGADIGSTSAEFGDVFIADDKFIKFGSDQDVTIGYDETTSDTLQIAGGDISIADDKKLFFGTDKDVSIEYDEDGTDTMLVTGAVTVTGNVTFSDGTTDVDIASHDGTNGLKLGGDLVTASATELNIMDGVTRSTAQINSARSGTVTSVSGGTGISGTVTTSGSLSLNTGIGQVGTYAFLGIAGSNTTITAGQTYTRASSGATNNNVNLVYAGMQMADSSDFDDDTAIDLTGSSVTTGLTGIWRAMGEANNQTRRSATLFLRIS